MSIITAPVNKSGKRLHSLKVVYQNNETGIRDTWNLFCDKDSIVGTQVDELIANFGIINARMTRLKL